MISIMFINGLHIGMHFNMSNGCPVTNLPMIVPFRACYGVLRFVMESGAKGCEVGH
mgnify:CR=1 FL=1